MFTQRADYGDPHPSHASFFYFQLAGTDHIGSVGGYVTAAQFDWLAERLGTQKLAEVRRG